MSQITTTHVVRTVPNPLPVTTDLVTQKRFEVVLTAATATFTVSPAALVATLPGNTAVWDKIQFHRFDVFSVATTSSGAYTELTATLENPSSGYFGDRPTGYSDAVGTFRRAHVGFRPNSLYKATWIDTTDTSPLLTITAVPTTGTTGTCLLQFVAVLRSSGISVSGPPADVHRPLPHSFKASEVRDLPSEAFELQGDKVVQVARVITGFN